MPAAGGPVLPVDLHHPLSVAAEEAGQFGPVAAGALDSERLDLAQRVSPAQQLGVASGGVATSVVARRRPNWSLAQATCTSLWVSTPTVRRAGWVYAMVVIAVPPARQMRLVDGTRRPGGRTALRRVWANRLLIRSRSPGRALQRLVTARADRSDTRHKAGGWKGQTPTVTAGIIAVVGRQGRAVREPAGAPQGPVIAYGVHESGRREVIGLDVGEAETESVLARLPAVAPRPRAGGGPAGHLRRPHRPQGRHRQGVRLPLAALHRPFPA